MKRKIILVIWTIAGIGLVLGGSEMYIKNFKPQIVVDSYGAGYDFGCFERGSYYFVKFKAKAKCILNLKGAEIPPVEMNFNSLGLRNREIEKNKPEGVKRILFVGDSFTVGWGVSDDESFPRVVENNLRFQGQQAETINAGLTAAGASYYYLFTKNQGSELNPDILVVGLYMFNDVAHDAFRPWLSTDEQGLPTKSGANRAYVDNRGNLMTLENGVPKRLFIPVLNNSHLFAVIYDRLVNEKLEAKEVGFSEYACLFRKNCHDLDANYARVEKLLKGLADLTGKIKAKLLVVLIPNEMQVDPRMTTKYNFPDIPIWDFALPNRVMTEFLNKQDISSLDLLPIMASVSAGKKLYFDKDDHWNSDGHAIAAQAITQKLREMGI
jgi:hypothetical protein